MGVFDNDNTQVQHKPLVPIKELKKVPKGFMQTADGTLIKIPAQQSIGPAPVKTRFAKEIDKRRGEIQQWKEEEQKKKQEQAEAIEAVVKMTLPSTYIGPLFNNNGKSYTDNLLSGEGTGNWESNLVIDLITPFAANKAVNVGKQVLIPANRAAHAYVSVAPIGYDRVGTKGYNWIKSMLTGKYPDIDNPIWLKDLPEEYIQELRKYFSPFMKNTDKIAIQARDDMWRIYNGLPQKYGTFIKTGDNTYAIDLDRINTISEGTFHPMGLKDGVIPDYITSAGGNVQSTITPLASQDGREYGIQTITDLADFQPFSRPTDKISVRLPIIKRISDSYNKFRTGISDKVKDIANRISYDDKAIKEFLATPEGSQLAEYGVFFPDMFPSRFYNIGQSINRFAERIVPKKTIADKIDNYFSDFEIGKISGGKPFLMETKVPYTSTLEDFSQYLRPTIRTSYGFVPEEYRILPPEVLYYKHNKPLHVINNTESTIQHLDNLINNTANKQKHERFQN